MKVLTYVIILILITSCVFLAGCITPNNVQTTGIHPGTTVIATNPTTVPAPDGTADISKKTDTTPKVPAPTYVPIKDINKHFLTIAFSEYNGVVLRQERSRPMTVALFGKYTPDDAIMIEQFFQDFNRVSKTQKFYPYLKSGEVADLWINIFPEDQLHNLQKNHKGIDQMEYTEYDGLFSDKILFTVMANQVFVNGDLPEDQRRHYLLRAVTYWLGITGEATDDESFFYPGNTGLPNLSDSDWKAFMILYGPVVKYNMTMSDVKNRLYLG
jgi:hypothetical protein